MERIIEISDPVYPRLYHDFSVEQGTGDILLGEVSMCNDDFTDNRFYPPMGRFPAIEEDEPPYRLLCTEYPAGKIVQSWGVKLLNECTVDVIAGHYG